MPGAAASGAAGTSPSAETTVKAHVPTVLREPNTTGRTRAVILANRIPFDAMTGAE